MKILVDTNVVLDVLLNRQPFVGHSSLILDAVEKSKVSGYLCATTFTTLDFLLKKALPRKTATEMLSKLLILFEISPVNRAVLENALRSRMKDYEDAVLAESASVSGCDLIVTRNVKDFPKSPVPAVDAIQFLAITGGR